MEEQIKKIINKVLDRHGWGIYFKAKPLMEMPVNGEANIYKINDIHISELEGAISDEVKAIYEEINTQGDTECQKKEGSEEM